MKKTILVSLLFILAACGPQATPTASPQSAVMSEVEGTVNAKEAGAQDFSPAADGTILNENGQVQTGDDGKTRLDLSGGSIVRVGPSSLFTLISVNPQTDDIQASLEGGEIWIVLSGGQLETTTPSGVAAVLGSRMGIAVDALGNLRITCLEGTCTFRNDTGDYAIPAGSVLECSGPNAIPTIQSMTPADVTEWLEIDAGVAEFFPALTAAAVTPTPIATSTLTPTATSVAASPTAAPTFSVLEATVTAGSLACRYGPGANYLYYYAYSEGNKVQVLGRADTAYGTWVYTRLNNNLQPCWVNSKFLDINGDLASLEPVYPEKAPLIQFSHASFPPPTNESATRTDDQVEIFWTGYELALGDRESAESPMYLVETWTCQAGQIVFTPTGAFTESAVVVDEAGCSEASHGRVFIAHKDGYIGPVEIPWPQ